MDDLVGLMALVQEPAATPNDKDALAAWKSVVALLDKPRARSYGRIFRDRKATAQRERAAPPPAMKKLSFCGLPETPAPTATARRRAP